MSAPSLSVAGRTIGTARPPWIVAEVGNNHGGDLGRARELVVAAHEAGADAVKLQTFKAANFVARQSAYFERLSKAELPRAWAEELMALAAERGTVLFSSVFDEESADMMEALGAPAYKIASGDMTHHPLLAHVARFGKPMIVSTGGATEAEVDAALAAICRARADTPVALMHCVSQYPAEPDQANLACMATMRARWGLPTGFSDHTIGTAVCVAAAALGAELIEKHFTLDKTAQGPDHKLSADPADMARLVREARAAWEAVGRVEKAPVEPADFIPLIRRSLTAAADIPAGTVLTRAMLAVKRPGTGLAPGAMDEVIGRRAARAIAADTTLCEEDLAP